MVKAGPFGIVEIERDDILPKSITHEVELSYNFIRYEFETENHVYWARTYIEKITEVSIFGPFDKADSAEHLKDIPIDERVIKYFRKRFQILMRLSDSGYEPIDQPPN